MNDQEAAAWTRGHAVGMKELKVAEKEWQAERAELRAKIERLTTLRPASEWRDDDGDVLWWRMPIQEAPYVGSPLECGWFEDFYTHWTPLPKVKEPK
jgi:hypothetical protein